ncbi:MAG TPA: cation diffusion facilitator family transporter [Thiobacillus sp.]|nr:cation diffusion facilitator family transporter [Gammaproteobacteria bacterium]OYZ26931.1 MAG: cation transporter [Hydrogenophilales bacterium 16-64-40]OZA33421.1 MAG: cation transporter [Hydrogenophilales bacterium 17-64-65]HQS83209.1 cation diffusion facilitator family transporter [Thiobacillus sp.]HQT33392.1 cation diffusion facilitator family transporter [Thiobacillus sp.]
MAAHKHDHGAASGHGAGHSHHHTAQNGTLIVALLLTLSFAGVEAVAGWWSGSLALLADAAHMVTDSSALGLAAAAAWLARRPPSMRHSYGLVRAEVLAALFNSLLMLVLIGFIVREALERVGTPRDIDGGTVIGVAVIGLAINLVVAWVLSRGEHTLNSRAALLHVLGDALGSVAAITAGIVIVTTGWTPIDPLLSLLVAALILFSALRLLREVLHVLMEGVPGHVQLAVVGRDLARLPGVRRVHDLHVWTLSSGTLALSAHLELRDLADWPATLAAAQQAMEAQHGISHVTLQPEVPTAAPLVRAPYPPVDL